MWLLPEPGVGQRDEMRGQSASRRRDTGINCSHCNGRLRLPHGHREGARLARSVAEPAVDCPAGAARGLAVGHRPFDVDEEAELRRAIPVVNRLATRRVVSIDTLGSIEIGFDFKVSNMLMVEAKCSHRMR